MTSQAFSPFLSIVRALLVLLPFSFFLFLLLLLLSPPRRCRGCYYFLNIKTRTAKKNPPPPLLPHRFANPSSTQSFRANNLISKKYEKLEEKSFMYPSWKKTLETAIVEEKEKNNNTHLLLIPLIIFILGSKVGQGLLIG
ncbi:unnamed protein product [Periconia digitata]|uniref:Uncharacterized protein n=1 Tax=Periconia digitata TaxID=1303443 RepID=A0A9W4U986_9PLEO|nr:unnamed protein product [Periconia digitata]